MAGRWRRPGGGEGRRAGGRARLEATAAYRSPWTASSWRESARPAEEPPSAPAPTHTHTYTHIPFNGPFSGGGGSAGTRKVKRIWILLEQEKVSGSGISCATCKSAPSSRQITTPAPHHSVFYRPDALSATQPTVSKH